jgi:hypothetical protein
MNASSGIHLWDPMRRFLERAADYLPVILAVLIVLVAGFFAALLLEGLTRFVLRLIRFDRVARRPQVADTMLRAGLRHTPSALAGQIVRWLVMILTLLGALSILSSEATDEVMGALVHYLPRLIAGLIIFVVGYAASTFVGRSVLLWAVNARLQGARWVAGGVQLLTGVFFVALALENLGFGREIAVVVLAILLGGGVLAAALAFGLAGKDLARQWLDRMTRHLHESDRDTLSHL